MRLQQYIYSAFFEQDSSWEDFISAANWPPNLSLENAVECVFYALSQNPDNKNWKIILLLDEIMKCEKPVEVLKEITSCLERYSRNSRPCFFAVVSVVNRFQLLKMVFSFSQKPVTFISLPHATIDECKTLFKSVFDKLPSDGSQNKFKSVMTKKQLETLLTYTGGHFKMLEFLYQVLHEHLREVYGPEPKKVEKEFKLFDSLDDAVIRAAFHHSRKMEQV